MSIASRLPIVGPYRVRFVGRLAGTVYPEQTFDTYGPLLAAKRKLPECCDVLMVGSESYDLDLAHALAERGRICNERCAGYTTCCVIRDNAGIFKMEECKDDDR